MIGCTADPTQLLVIVDSDMAVPNSLVKVRAEVRNQEGRFLASHEFELSERKAQQASTKFALPLSFGVLKPEQNPTDRVIVEVDALGTSTDSQPLFTRKAVTGFLEGKSLLLPMYLSSLCQSLECALGQTCTERGCVSEVVDENRLRESSGTDADLIIKLTAPIDAGTQFEDANDITDAMTIEDTGIAPDSGISMDASIEIRMLEWVFSTPTNLYFTLSEVTVDQFDRCVQANACATSTFDTRSDQGNCNVGYDNRENHPMNCVNWAGADSFCRWVGGRLPAEEEWYAEASNGGDRRYPWGEEPETCERAVMRENGGNGCSRNRTWAVCEKRNGDSVSGLCDMAGNVWEWTASRLTNGTHVLRGGAWYDSRQTHVRASGRTMHSPSFGDNGNGFRCVRDTAP